MEDKVLYNVLSKIGTGREYDAAPDREYLESLKKIGLINMDWDNSLTDLGRKVLSDLQNRFDKW